MTHRSKLYKHSDGSRFKGKPIEEIFESIYDNNTWQETPESVSSGTGSTLDQTRAIRDSLPKIFSEYHIESLLDIPCGDHSWMKEVNFDRISKYVGADIVGKLIEENRKNFSSSKKSFEVFDITIDSLPRFDLILARDCLVHFSFDKIQLAIKNIAKSSSKYLLTTTFADEKVNMGIDTGGWRPINLQLPPFEFGEPLQIINEECTEFGNTFADKSLALWEVSHLPTK